MANRETANGQKKSQPIRVGISHYGGPAGTRTLNQGIHCSPQFLVGVDYLFTLVVVNNDGRVRDAPACY